MINNLNLEADDLQITKLIEPIEEENALLIPGDSTYPSFFAQLYEQGGSGLLFETEGSVITDIWKSGCVNYNTALRKCAEHETLSKGRLLTGITYIHEPKVSVLLTGTCSQFEKLVPSVENWYDNHNDNQNQLVCTDEDFETAMVISTKLLLNAADAYNQIGGKDQLAVPEVKGCYQKDTFLASLPKQFSTGDCIRQGQQMGISERSCKRWLSNWTEVGTLKHVHGQYEKIA